MIAGMNSTNAPLVRDQTIGRMVKLTGDLALPGFSQYLDRDYSGGFLHTVVGIAAGAAIGSWAYTAVGLDSISRSLSGRGLLSHLVGFAVHVGDDLTDDYEEEKVRAEVEHRPAVKRASRRPATKRARRTPAKRAAAAA